MYARTLQIARGSERGLHAPGELVTVRLEGRGGAFGAAPLFAYEEVLARNVWTVFRPEAEFRARENRPEKNRRRFWGSGSHGELTGDNEKVQFGQIKAQTEPRNHQKLGLRAL